MLAVAPMVVFDRTSSMLDVNSVEPTCVEQAILESFKVKFSTVVPKARSFKSLIYISLWRIWTFRIGVLHFLR